MYRLALCRYGYINALLKVMPLLPAPPPAFHDAPRAVEEFSVPTVKLGATGDATELATLRRRLRHGRCTIGALLCALLCSLLFALQSSPEHERGFA